MPANILLIICPPEMETEVDAQVGRVFDGWDDENRPALRTHYLDELLEAKECPDDISAIWLFLPAGASSDQMNNAIDKAESWNMSLILSRSDESLPLGSSLRHGTIIAPFNTDGGQIRLILQTLHSQSDALFRMRQELTVTRHEMLLARRTQRAFLPNELPTVNNVSFSVLYRPASYVSGDIYDVQRLDERNVGFYVADAVGHGVPAALVTMFIKRSMPTKDIQYNRYRIIMPDEALSRLNWDMIDQESSTSEDSDVRFATACYAVLDSVSLELRVARAGHPPPVILRTNGETEFVSPPGLPLGVLNKTRYDPETKLVNPGDRLVFYSDGFETVFDSDPQPDYVPPEFMDLRDGTPQEALKELERKVDQRLQGQSLKDDLTAMVIDIAQ